MIKKAKKQNKGFSLVEMMVAMLILAIITVPMMTMLYFGIVNMEKQTAATVQTIISRETLQLIVDDLEKYATLSTRIEKVGSNITKLVILDDSTLPSATVPKKVMYVYDSDKKMLIRVIDNLQSVVLSSDQLSDRFYKPEDKARFAGSEPVVFERDNSLKTISVYLRVKIDQEATPQENKYVYNLREVGRRVIHGTEDGVICVNTDETYNFRDSSFTLETYLKLTDNTGDQCIFNLVDASNNSKVNLHINGGKLGLKLNGTDVVITGSYQGIPIELNKWKKVVVIYNDVMKKIKIYLTKSGLTDTYNSIADSKDLKLELVKEINFDTAIVFMNDSATVPINKIYIANTDDSVQLAGSKHGFKGCLYEPRIWKKVVDLYKDVEDKTSTDKYDYTKLLTGLEEGLIVYIKDDYRMKQQNVGSGYELKFEIKNEVNNKPMSYKNLEIYEEIPTAVKFDNISELIGY